MLGSVKNFDADNALALSNVKHNVIRETPVDNGLIGIIQTDLKQVFAHIVKDLHFIPPIFQRTRTPLQ